MENKAGYGTNRKQFIILHPEVMRFSERVITDDLDYRLYSELYRSAVERRYKWQRLILRHLLFA